MPEWTLAVRQCLAPLALRPEREAEIADELSQHLEDRYRQLLHSGSSHDDAMAGALGELDAGTDGTLAAAMFEAERRTRQHESLGSGKSSIGGIAKDVRYAARALRRRPGFTAVVLLTLAIGIGANTALFSVVDQVLLRPLPYPDPGRLVEFWGTAPEKGLPEVQIPEALYAVYRDRNRSFTNLAMYGRSGLTLTGDGAAERLDGARVSPEFFAVMGTTPYLGRFFTREEAVTDSTLAVMLSYSLWSRRFGGDSSLLGRTIRLNDAPVVVIGVMPQGFDFPYRAQYWVAQEAHLTRFNCWCWSQIGRLKPGITAEDARRDIADVTDKFGMARRDIFPDAKPGGARIVAQYLQDRVTASVRRPLWVLLGAGGLVLLIACANIANLLLARAAGRQHEIALRCCLGAQRGRIAVQLLAESLLLSFTGAAIGVAVAWWGVQFVRRIPVDQIPRVDSIALDWRAIAFSVTLAVITGALFGVAPAIRGSRVDLQRMLKDGGRGSTLGKGKRLSDAFVVAQFALSLVLLVGAGLMLRSFRELLAVDLGYRVENTLTARVQLPFPRYANDTVVRAFYSSLLESIRAIPGVSAAGITTRPPLARGNPQDNIIAEGKEPKPGDPVRVANVRLVDAGYFDAIGTPLRAGRGFGASERNGTPRAAVVDELFAKHFWPGENPIGKRYYHGGDTSSTRWVTVIGVVPNTKHGGLAEVGDLQTYEPFDQLTSWTNYVVVRATTVPETILPEMRRALSSLDPTLPFYEVRTMEDALDRSIGIRKLTDRLLFGFALTAALLAAIGIYGVMSLNVAARIREFGVRLALGATGRSVMSLVVSRGMILALCGVIVGFVGALWLTRFIRTMLFGIQPFDALTFVTVSGLLVVVALVACALPAWRATRTDPMRVLRSD